MNLARWLAALWRRLTSRPRASSDKPTNRLSDRVVVRPKSDPNNPLAQKSYLRVGGEFPPDLAGLDFDPGLVIFPLIESVKIGDASAVRSLIEARVDVNVRDDNGMTALHHAAALGARNCLRALVKSGQCDFLVRDNLGRTAAELALEWSADPAAAILLAKKEARQAATRNPS